jgi:hypothetical protein
LVTFVVGNNNRGFMRVCWVLKCFALRTVGYVTWVRVGCGGFFKKIIS